MLIVWQFWKSQRPGARSACSTLYKDFFTFTTYKSDKIQGVPFATEPGISLIILSLMRILQRNLKRTTDTFLFISHTTNVFLFKFLCNIFIGVRIIKEMPGSVASGTHCTKQHITFRKTSVFMFFLCTFCVFVIIRFFVVNGLIV